MEFIKNLKESSERDFQYIEGVYNSIVENERSKPTFKTMSIDSAGNVKFTSSVAVNEKENKDVNFHETSLYIRTSAKAILDVLLERSRSVSGKEYWEEVKEKIPYKDDVIDTFYDYMHRFIYGDLKKILRKRKPGDPNHAVAGDVVVEITVTLINGSGDKKCFRPHLAIVYVGASRIIKLKNTDSYIRKPIEGLQTYHTWQGDVYDSETIRGYKG